MRVVIPFAALIVVGLAACDSPSPTDSNARPSDNPRPPGDAVMGQFAFVNECASCHASGDGADLAIFQFSDTTIIRRAVAHVDSATARNIVAHIRRLIAPPLAEEAPLLQPRGVVLSSDVAFAVALFGSDAFPWDMTSAKMRSINTRDVAVAIKLPIWSDEASNLDWMPDMPLPAAILDDQGSMARALVAGYRAAPTKENLIRAVTALRTADRRIASAAAPCLLEDSLRVNYVQCFQVRRWTSTLVAQHLLRNGMSASLELSLHDVWWDVGNAARKSIKNGVSPIANAKQNWASWMYLSWSFDPAQHSTSYTGGGLNQVGLSRHATFVALRSQVARGKGSSSPYEDARNAVNFAPSSWAYNVAIYGLTHLLERLDSKDVPNAMSLQSARDHVVMAVTNAQKKVPMAQRAAIAQLGDQVLAKLQ